MNLRNRIMKLEQITKSQPSVLVMIRFNNKWTHEQQQQINETKANERKIIMVNFI